MPHARSPLCSNTTRVRRAPAAAGSVMPLPTPSLMAPGWPVSGDGALQCFLSSALCPPPQARQAQAFLWSDVSLGTHGCSDAQAEDFCSYCY